MVATPSTVDARPTTTDLQLYAGDDLTLHLEVTDSSGANLDLTGYTAEAQIRATADATEVTDFTATITGNAIDLTLTGTDTAALPSRGVWDVQITSGTGAVTTLAAGRVTVTPEVTR